MSVYEFAPKPLQEVELFPGDRIRVETIAGFVYDIEAGDVVKGLVQATVTRRAIDQPRFKVSEAVYRKAGVISDKPGRIAVGEQLSVFGINVETGQPDDFRTGSVESISRLIEPES